MRTCTILFLSFFSVILHSQNSVSYETLGISFSVPNGWYGEEVAAGYLMTAQNGEGYILMKPHEAKTIAELKAGAQEGIVDEASASQLNLSSNIEQIDAKSIGAEFKGIVEWSPAKAYVIGLLNPYGKGVIIIATTAKKNYSDRFKELAVLVANSVQFTIPKESGEVKKWAQKLKNSRLTAMDSFSSSDGAYGEYGSSHSSKKVLDLCAQGYFRYSASSSANFDSEGGFGNAGSSNNGDGTWKVIGNVEGQAVLQLTFVNQEVYELVIKFEDYKTFLNGERYFRTYDDKGPDCF